VGGVVLKRVMIGEEPVAHNKKREGKEEIGENQPLKKTEEKITGKNYQIQGDGDMKLAKKSPQRVKTPQPPPPPPTKRETGVNQCRGAPVRMEKNVCF